MSEEWEVGQHPGRTRGWIVRPVLFGRNVNVLPKHEGGHVELKNEADAHVIAASKELLAAAENILNGIQTGLITCEADEVFANATRQLSRAVDKAKGRPAPRVYAFHRAEGFYPIVLRDDADARKNAESNPGTLRVTAEPSGREVWRA